jgi:trimethylamine:corrinoid methyltransferase-like protein
MADQIGIRCPACNAVDNYSGGQGKKGDNSWTRNKKCKACGADFATIEVPLGLIEVKRRKAPVAVVPVTVAPAATPVTAAATAPVAVATAPVAVATAPVANIFNPPT